MNRGYAALFAILILSSIMAISLINANFAIWQVDSSLLDRNTYQHLEHLANHCQSIALDELKFDNDYRPDSNGELISLTNQDRCSISNIESTTTNQFTITTEASTTRLAVKQTKYYTLP